MSGGTCGIHGPQENWTGVCLAIGDGLKDSKAVGFVWGIDEENFPWAICSYCDQEVQKGFVRPHKVVPLCQGCFEDAWALNGKPERVE